MTANLAVGNYGKAAVDAVGILVDGAATVAPGVPGGAATVINATRAADAVAPVVAKIGGTATVGELKLLHSAETIGKRPDLAKLSDKDLLKSVTNPKNGDRVKVSTESGKVVDGNSRVAELKRRADDVKSTIQPDTKIPIEPYKRDNSMF